MKKILTMILAVMLIVTSVLFVSCDSREDDNDTNEPSLNAPEKNEGKNETKDGPVDTLNGKTPAEAYAAATKTFSEMEKYDIVCDSKVTSSASGFNSSSEIDGTYKVGEDSAYAKMTMMGTEYELWYVDGVAYVSEPEKKTKYDGLTLDEFVEYYVGGFDVTVDWIEEKYIDFTGVKFDKNGDVYTLTLELTAEKVVEYTEADEMTDAAFTSVSIEVRFDGMGNVTSYVLTKSYSEDISGIAVNVTETTEYTINAIGNVDDVSAPADAEDYVETTGDVYEAETEDMDGDGDIDDFDEYLAYMYYDNDEDGDIDMDDVLAIDEITENEWKTEWIPIYQETYELRGETGDMDGDGDIDGFDEYLSLMFFDNDEDGDIDMDDVLASDEITENEWKTEWVPVYEELYNEE